MLWRGPQLILMEHAPGPDWDHMNPTAICISEFYASCIILLTKDNPITKFKPEPCIEEQRPTTVATHTRITMSAFQNLEDLYPVPFPEDVQIAEIEKISLNKLLNSDHVELQRVFDICTGVGFFYLDMMDHPKGKQMWEDACYACRSGQEILPYVPLATKRAYKAPAGVGVLDRGYVVSREITVNLLKLYRYQTGAIKEDGTPRDSEMFMVWHSLNQKLEKETELLKV